jgi:hypothetical protein
MEPEEPNGVCNSPSTIFGLAMKVAHLYSRRSRPSSTSASIAPRTVGRLTLNQHRLERGGSPARFTSQVGRP